MTTKKRPIRRTLATLGLSAIAALALSGIAAGSASAHQFVVCTSTATVLLYEDSECSKTGGTHSYGLMPTQKYPTSAVMTGTADFKLRIKNYFNSIKELVITCSSQTSENGVLESFLNVTLRLHGSSGGVCQTNVPNTTAEVAALTAKGTPTELNGKHAVEFTPESGTSFATITFHGGALNGVESQLSGSFSGYMNSPGSYLQFSKETTSSIVLGVWGGTLEWTSGLRTAAGEAVLVS